MLVGNVIIIFVLAYCWVAFFAWVYRTKRARRRRRDIERGWWA